jgi:glycine/D-amino acid oxidase-like deaminating enzyme
MPQSKTYDVLVAGAGVLGLWVARMALRRGLSVALVDAAAGPGRGASGTPLAVLLPHLPDRAEPKRAFQRDALATLGGEIADLEAEAGHVTGYVRRGRVMPIRKDTFLAKAEQAVAGARSEWAGLSAECEIIAADHRATIPDGWLDPETAPLGALHDTLSAAVRADTYVAALAEAVSATAPIQWNRRLVSYDAHSGCAIDCSGGVLPSAKAVVVAAGFGSFEILSGLLDRRTGDGVKGHAATFRLAQPLAEPDRLPVLYDNGIYVVPLDPETVSIGSTTEYDWSDARPSAEAAAAMIARAKALCPLLRTAEQTALWAGIRPRAATRNPLVGAVPGQPGLFVATGGYKITFGIAHRLAACLVDEIVSGRPASDLPETFHASTLAA